MPVQGMLDIPPPEVTPEAGEGTLGTWRFRTGPRHRPGGNRVLKVGTSCARKPQLCGACSESAGSVSDPGGRRRRDSQGQNRTGENPLSGIAGGPGETWLMVGLGTQPATERAVLVTPTYRCARLRSIPTTPCPPAPIAALSCTPVRWDAQGMGADPRRPLPPFRGAKPVVSPGGPGKASVAQVEGAPPSQGDPGETEFLDRLAA
jgi:hypothetical protein